MSTLEHAIAEQDQSIAQTVEREGKRLRNYIRKHVLDREVAEDILQEVFLELVEAYRLLKPVEQMSAWLFRVAKNRIIDRFRGKKLDSLSQTVRSDESDGITLEDLLPSQDGGPDAVYARSLLLEEINEALEEIPEEQRSVFIAHEWEGYSFKEIAAETGVSVNTLLSRKHYAVKLLRRRLQTIYDEFAGK